MKKEEAWEKWAKTNEGHQTPKMIFLAALAIGRRQGLEDVRGLIKEISLCSCCDDFDQAVSSLMKDVDTKYSL